MAQAASAAVESRWYELTEAGGGGIERRPQGRRRTRARGDLLQSPSLWIALALPIVYLLVLSLSRMIGSVTWARTCAPAGRQHHQRHHRRPGRLLLRSDDEPNRQAPAA